MIETEADNDQLKQRIDNLVILISSLSASQKQLTMSALDLQSLALTKKREIKASIDRAVELGEIQDVFIEVLKNLTEQFVATKSDEIKRDEY